jgi:His/Glu/Gln/Arg/opine family amino acid ABC transporter permease subunit
VNYSFDWSALWGHRDLIVSGFITTVELASISLILATLLGVAIGTCGATGARGLRALAIGWVELIRSIPLLIHMYIWYMALAMLKLPAFACATLALSIYSSAYVAEVVRAGILGLPAGQAKAGLACGLTQFQTLRLIVYPQVLRRILPSLASVFSQLIKDSSLASVIAVTDITYQAGALDGLTFRTFEVYTMTLVLYLVLVSIVNRLLGMLVGASIRSSTYASTAKPSKGLRDA